MKIGILTYHRAHNYGAVLQCYALQETLRRLGHQVSVIDYRQEYVEATYSYCSPQILKRKLSNLGALRDYMLNNVLRFRYIRHRRSVFEGFVASRLATTSPCGSENIPEDFDVYIVGSDQMWSEVCTGGSFDKVYLGAFRRSDSSSLAGYAISSNRTSVEVILNSHKDLISGFNRLSFRESYIAETLAPVLAVEPQVCVDPTLLTEASLWESMTDSRWAGQKYVLMYEISRPRGDKGYLRRKAEEMAAAIGEGCKVIDLSDMSYDVEDFVSLFRYASYVVTTSFHGTVFSLIFERPFRSVRLGCAADARYEHLLNAVGAGECCVDMSFEAKPVPVDFTEIRTRLKQYREGSMNFLKEL